ncbi:MAG: hypothetical protein AB1427_01195 [Thermodesulfobacteriota bacterium]
MQKIKEQVKSEIKLLPMMIGKFIGGLLAVVGFAGAVVIVTRRPQVSFADIFPYAAAGVLGIAVFYAASRLLAKRVKRAADAALSPGDKKRMSMIAWAVLLILAGVFILITWVMTR